MRPDLDRLPGPLREQVRGDEPAHGLLQRIVIALLPRTGVLGPGRGGQGVQHRADHCGALRGQVPVENAGTLEGGHQPHRAVLQRTVRVVIGQLRARPLVHLGEHCGQVPQIQACRGGRDEEFVGLLPELLRQLVGPLADRSAVGLGQVLGDQRRDDLGMGGGPLGPGGVAGGGAAGDPGLVHQPGPRAVIRILGVALADGERGQERGPHRGADRVGPLQPAQALGLGLRRLRGRVGGGQIGQAGQHHVHRFADAGESRGFGGVHLGCLLPDARGPVRAGF